jgi:hypothetical protein
MDAIGCGFYFISSFRFPFFILPPGDLLASSSAQKCPAYASLWPAVGLADQTFKGLSQFFRLH